MSQICQHQENEKNGRVITDYRYWLQQLQYATYLTDVTESIKCSCTKSESLRASRNAQFQSGAALLASRVFNSWHYDGFTGKRAN